MAKPGRVLDSEKSPALVKLSHLLETDFIGFSAAIDWIIRRGLTIPDDKYEKTFDAAMQEFVEFMKSLPGSVAESVVHGVDSRSDVPIPEALPAGVWRATAISDLDEAHADYVLLAVDDDDEWAGTLYGTNGHQFRRIHVNTQFLLEGWPRDGKGALSKRVKKVVSAAKVRQLITMIISKARTPLAPLTIAEIESLVWDKYPLAPRAVVRDIYQRIGPPRRRGPRGLKKDERNQLLDEFRQKLNLAELQN